MSMDGIRRAGVAVVLLAGWALPGGAQVTGEIDRETVLGDQFVAVTTNGLLTVTAAPRPFNNSSLNIGIAGGWNNASVDTYTGVVETLTFAFDASVGIQSIKTAWTDGHIHLDGFAADPGVYIVTDPGVSAIPITVDAYDAANRRVVIHHSWQNNIIAEFGFSNVAASAGQAITVYVEDFVIDTAGPQVGIHELTYTSPAPGGEVYTVGTDLVSNRSAATPDGLVSLAASPRDFASGSGWFGVSGGSNASALDNNVNGGTNAVPGEQIVFSFDETVAPLSFKTIWTRAHIVWEGFTADPGAYVITDPNGNMSVLPYDPTNRRVVVVHPWQGGAQAEIGFANPAAGAGQDLSLWVYDPNEANPQVAVVGVLYGTPPPGLAITGVEWVPGGGEPGMAVRWASQSGEVFAVEATGVLTGGWSAVETNIAATPPTNTYTLAGTAGAAFVRLAREARSGTLFSDDLEAADTPTRWTSTPSNGLAWEWGSPSPLTPPAVGPPAAASGASCFGTALDGVYGTSQQPSLRSPPIDLAGISQATLVFRQFRDIEESGSQTNPFQFDKGVVNILRLDETVVGEAVYLVEGTGTDWETAEVTLPAAAMGQAVILEFVLDADGFQASGQGGWYIDDVEVIAP